MIIVHSVVYITMSYASIERVLDMTTREYRRSAFRTFFLCKRNLMRLEKQHKKSATLTNEQVTIEQLHHLNETMMDAHDAIISIHHIKEAETLFCGLTFNTVRGKQAFQKILSDVTDQFHNSPFCTPFAKKVWAFWRGVLEPTVSDPEDAVFPTCLRCGVTPMTLQRCKHSYTHPDLWEKCRIDPQTSELTEFFPLLVHVYTSFI